MEDSALAEDDFQDFKGVQLQLNTDNIEGASRIEASDTESVTSTTKLPTSSVNNENADEQPLAGGSWSQRLTNSIWRNSDNPQPKTEIALAKPFEREDPKDYFTYRDAIVEDAIKEVRENLLSHSDDGELIGAWLLTEISLWDNEKERLILLSDKYILTVKYDFIALRQLDYRKIPLSDIDTIVSGDLVYPPGSLIPDRGMKGIRLMWNNGKPVGFLKRWNPFNGDIPFNTFTSHPLFWHKDCPDEASRYTYNVEDFSLKVINAVEDARHTFAQLTTTSCKIYHKPIVLQNYVGIGSVIHNKNALGFFKIRGKFSF